MRMTTTSILMALTLVAGMSAANAQIASKQYVDDRETAVLTGSGTEQEKTAIYQDAEITSSELEGASTMVDTIGVTGAVAGMGSAINKLYSAVDDKVNTTQSVYNAIMVTDNSGNVGMQTGNFINDDFIQSAGVSLDKLILPSVPAACSATGGSCVLMYVGGTGYVWEVVSRDSNETISTTGSVTGTSTGIHPDFTAATGSSGAGVVISFPSCTTVADCPSGFGFNRCVNGVCKNEAF